MQNDLRHIGQGGYYEDSRARFERCWNSWEPKLTEHLGQDIQVVNLFPENGVLGRFLDTLVTYMAMKAVGSQPEHRRDVLLSERFLTEYPDFKVLPLSPHYLMQADKSSVRMTLNDNVAPVLIYGLGLDKPVAFVRAMTPYGNSDIATDAYVFYSSPSEDSGDALKKLMGAFDAMRRIEKEVSHIIRQITVYGGRSIDLPEQSWTTWDDVFLAPPVVKDVREDIMFFVNNRSEFERVGLPYKRGYLLCGPPGNGKTSICRAIATSMPFAAYMFDFSNDNLGNSDLTQCFEWASENAPSVFFLEDIDRIYSADDKNEHANVTLDHLLNCLDGIATNNGVVVVATANNPEKLDSAILSRPGRFDKVVVLGDPDLELRLRYLSHLFRHSDVDASVIEWAAEETEGLSMAFMKEVFLVSMARALTSQEKLERRHVEDALEAIFKQFQGISRKGRRKAGFGG